jgi:3-oxoacyl-[acyl-carrier protein] reductase
MNLGLKSKNVVITGGSRGIGKAIAFAFAAEGANVAIGGPADHALRQTEAELATMGVTVYTHGYDATDPAALSAFLEAAKVRLGRVDVLVNNVSGLPDWESSLNVDLLSFIRATEKVVPWMTKAGGGNVLYIASNPGKEACTPGHGAAKAALMSYAKTMAASLALQGVRFNCLIPGCIEFVGGSWEPAGNRPFFDKLLSSIPSGKMGRTDEVANVALFLASDAARWVTGACVPVDGGRQKAMA